jgi:hypothetical protein
MRAELHSGGWRPRFHFRRADPDRYSRIDHLRRRDARFRQPNEGFAHALRAIGGGEPRDHEMAAGPRLLRRNRGAEPSRGARHGCLQRLAKRHVQRKQLDTFDRRACVTTMTVGMYRTHALYRGGSSRPHGR